MFCTDLIFWLFCKTKKTVDLHLTYVNLNLYRVVLMLLARLQEPNYMFCTDWSFGSWEFLALLNQVKRNLLNSFQNSSLFLFGTKQTYFRICKHI